MGIFDKFKIGFKKSASAFSSGLKEIIIKKEIDDQNLNRIEEFLIQSDVGVEAASEIKEIISNKKIDPNNDIQTEINEHINQGVSLYNKLLNEGVAPEQARAVLPQSMHTNWIWSGTLYAFARVCGLRLDDHAQKETQEIAKQLDIHWEDAFPISWKYLTKHKE